MKNLSVFDSNGLFHYTENDRDLAVQLLQMAVLDLSEFLTRAKESYRNENTAALRHYIHNIKGISGTTGAQRVHSLSSSCEHLLKSDPSDRNIQKNIEDLEDEINLFCSSPEVIDFMGSYG